ncbi:MAG: triphosphoribosyl-dephospho-CoA synthetase, partial [Planctomycetales bacterium]|nr:triphosphoribosyl-dephospho-CoA synthetase [Planctomycetales bacterium]NIM09623.1 triphosphoribosyl-dephospho-CoA synthetase [Planctomycetales bacterium]NIN09106.1 triphosphoribosyl-dephospho-CoA synthetase [Planctomycetales bacterium]NIN78213.1 triphosphoribosyl-dephospho-CoA synthetase [Planctomycetales bacterium]NIO35404.1 triphosphoribosyl-dephospho-CoA synthetase [Planctomycetales bacterium]
MNRLTIGQSATLACLWEVMVPKPGNVHRAADFEDLTFGDFVASAVAIGPAMERAGRETGVGQTVWDAIWATRQLVDTNTNLG